MIISLKFNAKLKNVMTLRVNPDNRIKHFFTFVKKIYMEEALKYAHSGLRWVALLFLVVAIINAFSSQNKGIYAKKDKMINLITMIILQIQLLIGGVLIFIGTKAKYPEGWMAIEKYRFFGLEHIIGMLLAIIIVTYGRKNAEKKLVGTRDKHRRIMFSYTLGLILILLSIPWPFREALGVTTWF
jgi:hypothetical protein